MESSDKMDFAIGLNVCCTLLSCFIMNAG